MYSHFVWKNIGHFDLGLGFERGQGQGQKHKAKAKILKAKAKVRSLKAKAKARKFGLEAKAKAKQPCCEYIQLKEMSQDRAQWRRKIDIGVVVCCRQPSSRKVD